MPALSLDAKVAFTVTAVGDVDDFTSSVIDQIKRSVALASGHNVSTSDVTVTVRSGSVILHVEVAVPSAIAVAVQRELEVQLTTPTAAEAMLAASNPIPGGSGFVVRVVSIDEPAAVADPSPASQVPPPLQPSSYSPTPSSPSPSPSEPQNLSKLVASASFAPSAGLVGGVAVVVLAVAVAVAVLVRRKRRTRHPPGARHRHGASNHGDFPVIEVQSTTAIEPDTSVEDVEVLDWPGPPAATVQRAPASKSAQAAP